MADEAVPPNSLPEPTETKTEIETETETETETDANCKPCSEAGDEVDPKQEAEEDGPTLSDAQRYLLTWLRRCSGAVFVLFALPAIVAMGRFVWMLMPGQIQDVESPPELTEAAAELTRWSFLVVELGYASCTSYLLAGAVLGWILRGRAVMPSDSVCYLVRLVCAWLVYVYYSPAWRSMLQDFVLSSVQLGGCGDDPNRMCDALQDHVRDVASDADGLGLAITLSGVIIQACLLLWLLGCLCLAGSEAVRRFCSSTLPNGIVDAAIRTVLVMLWWSIVTHGCVEIVLPLGLIFF